MATKYYVCHGPSAVHSGEVSAGSSITSGQPNIEQFDNEAAAKTRAEELGYVFPEDITE